MHFRALSLLCAVLLAPSLAQAAELWRCEVDGVPSFVQKPAGKGCKKVYSGSSRATSRPGPASASISPAPPLPDRAQAAAAGLPLSLPTDPVSPTPGAPLVAIEAAKPRVRQNAPPTNMGRGTIYRRVVNGVVELSSSPMPGAVASRTFVRTCYTCNLSNASFRAMALNREAYSDTIRQQASHHGLDPEWVRAIIHAESNFNPAARSPKGAQGLMQLMPATANRFGVGNAYDPDENIRGGTTYLAWLLRRFNGDHRLAAAAYNAGEGAVDRHGGVPPYAETRQYVERVAHLWERYRK